MNEDCPGLLASAIIRMDGKGGLAGWRWIFILEGIATVLIACLASATMPPDLASAKFFTSEEREFASEWTAIPTVTRLCADTMASTSLPAHTDCHDKHAVV